MKTGTISIVSLFTMLLVVVIAAPAFGQGAIPSQPMPTAENPALISVDLQPDPVVIQALQSLDLDIAYVGRGGEGIHIVADGADLKVLRQAGIPFDVLSRDVVAFYQSRFDQNLARSLGYGSMGGFYTYSEVVAKLDEFRSNYPNLISAKMSIGQGREGRDIWAAKISDNPDVNENEPEAIIDCLTHAREPQGMMTTLYFADWVLENYPADPLAKFLVEEREMWIIPVQNPDGYVYNETTKPGGGGMWRKNRRKNNFYSWGVDLNRNWGYKWGYDNAGSSGSSTSETYRGPYSMSEPETQATANFIAARGATERMSIHCYGNMWLIPWCYDYILTNQDALFRELAVEMAPWNYDIGTSWELLYKVNGGSLDWDWGDQGIITFSPEMGGFGDGFWPQTDRIMPIAEMNLPSLQYFYGIAGSFMTWTEMTVTEIIGNGNGHPEPGETVEIEVEVKNAGLLDATTTLSLDLSTVATQVNVTSASAQLPLLSARSSSNNAAQPFVIEILANAKHGDVIPLELEMLFDNTRLVGERDLVIGIPRRLISDTMEIDRGWQAGVPGDTAISGIWERVDPNGTWLQSEPIQPENDHTAGGSRCFITGNSSPGADPGANDVDDGKTTLLSPIFDLSGGRLARVGYSRWWANAEGRAGRSGVDDTWIVEISNDGGFTWTEIESVFGAKHNHWEEVTLEVDDVITATGTMRLRFVAEDGGPVYPNYSIVEAGVDDFWVECFSSSPILTLFGRLVPAGDVAINVAWDVGATYAVYASRSVGGAHPIQAERGIWSSRSTTSAAVRSQQRVWTSWWSLCPIPRRWRARPSTFRPTPIRKGVARR